MLRLQYTEEHVDLDAKAQQLQGQHFALPFELSCVSLDILSQRASCGVPWSSVEAKAIKRESHAGSNSNKARERLRTLWHRVAARKGRCDEQKTREGDKEDLSEWPVCTLLKAWHQRRDTCLNTVGMPLSWQREQETTDEKSGGKTAHWVHRWL